MMKGWIVVISIIAFKAGLLFSQDFILPNINTSISQVNPAAISSVVNDTRIGIDYTQTLSFSSAEDQEKQYSGFLSGRFGGLGQDRMTYEL